MDWRVIIALARYGGLRCPSEVLRLRWEDVNWNRDRFYVRSSKTERYEGKDSRLVPLFPEVCKELEALFFHIADTSNPVEFVVNRYRDPERTNLGTQFARIVKMSGIGPIPRPFDNMRASRSTEVYVEFGAYLESEWIGHSSKVAHDHYLQVREEDFERASGRTVSGVVLANQSDCDEHAESCREKPSKVVFPALEKNFPAVFPAARNGNERYGAVAKK